MATNRAFLPRKDSLDILLNKIARMREELLMIERALERMQKDAAELVERREGSRKRESTHLVSRN